MSTIKRNYYEVLLPNQQTFQIEANTPKEAITMLMKRLNCKVKSIVDTKNNPNVRVKLLEGYRISINTYRVVFDKDISKIKELHEFLTEKEISAILKKYKVYYGYDLWDKTDVDIPVPKGNVKHLEFYSDSIQRGYDDYSDATVAISYPKGNIQTLILALQALEKTKRISPFDESVLIKTLQTLINTLKTNK